MPVPTVSATQVYSAARAIAPRVQEHFARHLATMRGQGGSLAMLVPDAPAIEGMVDAAFWASLRREEVYVPKISLAFLPPERAGHPLLFQQPLPVVPDALARLGPAVERPGIHLGVWRQPAGLYVWGITWGIPPFCVVLEVIAPGLLVVKHRRAGDSGKFANVVVLEGDRIKMVDERASSLPDCPELLTSLLGFDAPASWGDALNELVELAVSMRRHGRGGSMLVVPAGTDAWRKSIVHPIAYPVSPPFTKLADLTRHEALETGAEHTAWAEEIARAVDAFAGLTAIDGATVINDRHELLAFGVKLGRRDGSPRVEQVVVTEPIEDSVPTVVHPSELGGTRHLSAAQFVHDQRDAVALVASQDGRFTVFAWSPCEEIVHAHRVETLLL